MNPSIPASAFVNVNPGVITAGGSGLILNGLLLSQAQRVPHGQVLSFATAAAVAAYFGLTSIEYSYAAVYFQGFDNSQIKPAALLITDYNGADAVAGYVRGATLGLTLAQLEALPAATLTLSIDGGPPTATGNINLAAVGSFNAAAAAITAAIGGGATCTWDVVSQAFQITSDTTGNASAVAVTDSALAASLKLEVSSGAVTSPGAAATTPGAFMAGIANTVQNWASFTTVFEPSTADLVAFAAWVSSTNKRFIFVGWTTQAAATVANDETTFGPQVKALAYDGTIALYQPSDEFLAPFVMGLAASTDYTQTDGRVNFAFKGLAGLVPGVTDQQTLDNLIANGYNGYCAVATANANFQYFYPGQISGEFLWADSYAGQIYLNNALQLALMNLLVGVRSIPYNAEGYGLIRAACADPINAALNAGVIRAGVVLSSLQAAEVNAAAGIAIDQTLTLAGYYLQIKPASPQVRAERGSPPMTLWYMDGQSVQQINLSSINVQ